MACGGRRSYGLCPFHVLSSASTLVWFRVQKVRTKSSLCLSCVQSVFLLFSRFFISDHTFFVSGIPCLQRCGHVLQSAPGPRLFFPRKEVSAAFV